MVSHFKQVLAELQAVRPPAPVEAVKQLGGMDFASVYAQEPQLILDLVVRITADCIVACYDLGDPGRADYLGALQEVSRKLNELSGNASSDAELSTYLSKFDLRLAEFG
jgi:hypothetical protein